ncbi:TetR/AcrR family transcriptional regulator [Gordonia sp. TBRC 11910]|uniref:TetR/AcrR family transcriptional regulator n=2 Tax=Gordonia asplenii TaxID=2725283 RepID=A0A848KYH1_9ACTN|nr:TetR/AcrR family transcriptional regulator [Gordonia asplenii]
MTFPPTTRLPGRISSYADSRQEADMPVRPDRSTTAYFAAAYTILAEDGYAGLKLAQLCERVGVTTGGFYHNFKNWRDFTTRFLEHWHTDRTTRLIALVSQESDPLARLQLLLNTASNLPHSAESAIRVWSTTDREVAVMQRSVDLERLQIVIETFRELSLPEDAARRRAVSALYLLIGHEQAGGVADIEALRWALNALITSALAPDERP